jgi:hypothetical protein
VAKDDARPTRQAGRHSLGIGGAIRVGEEEQGRQGLPQSPARR